MMNQNVNKTSLAERLVDSQAEMFSFREVISKVFLRPKLFLFALLIPPLMAVLMASWVPVDWSASTKILIRYSAADTGILKSLVSEGGLGLSGATSAELIKSKPVLEKTIQNVGITDKDVYQDSFDIISGTIFGSVKSLFLKDKSNGGPVTSDQAAIEKTALVNSFKASLDSSSKKTGKAQSIEILEKSSQVPESMKLDELITLQVKSFNREKVDDMANGLAAAFIDEYYQIYANEAKKQTEYLDSLVRKEEQELKQIETATPADFDSGRVQMNSSGRELISKDVPILTSMATQLMAVESELTKAQQIYASASPQVSRLHAQAAHLKFMLKKQERIEISKQLLEQLKTRRYQAMNTESIYKNRLVPITIAEYADEPAKSGAKKIMRVAISGVIGTMLGAILAISLMIVLNVLDPFVHFRKDIEQLLPLPIVGSIAKIKRFVFKDYRVLSNHMALDQSMWQLISRVGEKNSAQQAKVIAVTSSTNGEGATFCATALALSLAKGHRNKVCLIDANFMNAGLTHLFNLQNQSGFIDALLEEGINVEKHQSTDTGLVVVGAGKLARKTELGFYASKAKDILHEMQQHFDYIVIDSGATLMSNEALVFTAFADEALIVAASGVTRKSILKKAVGQLETNGAKITGIIFNQSKEVLPALIYNIL